MRDTRKRNRPTINVRAKLGRFGANQAAIKLPAKAPQIIRLDMSKSTLPVWKCLNAALDDIKTMLAREVATATSKPESSE